jgi:lysophospholipase L1-like esterase
MCGFSAVAGVFPNRENLYHPAIETIRDGGASREDNPRAVVWIAPGNCFPQTTLTKETPLKTALHARLLSLLAVCALASVTAYAAPKPGPDHWVGTWGTAPMAAVNKPDGLGSADMTLRQIVHVSLGGAYTRVVLTNEFGTEPLQIGAVHVALSAGGGGIKLASANAVTFGGSPTITIPAGAMAVSDGFALTLPTGADVAVSIFVPAQTISKLSQHGFADQTNYIAPGNVVGKATLEDAKPIVNWTFLKGIDVRVAAEDASIVTFGDSITDGAKSTKDANLRWPDILAGRLAKEKKTAGLGVLNMGIGGNRVLHDNTGPNALARFDRDVIAQAGVKYVVVMESINDIGHAFDPKKPYDVVSAADIIQAFKQMAERAHAHGIRIIGATLTPYVGAGYQSEEGQAARVAVNTWIRTSSDLDGVIDFDKATLDPANPTAFNPAYDSGDHLHPKDAGYKAMGESVDLKLFTGKK